MDQSTTRPVSVAAPRTMVGPARATGARGALAGTGARIREALTVEVLLYALFVALAAITRFWDLGSRALHHDESLHAYFSWRYYEGLGYTHDPMMHGPLLFHLMALVYHLFGASDYTARIAPAVFGTLLPALPWLLRRQLGRVSMLITSSLLLISPGIWYYGRFARNEAWCLAFTLLIFIGLVRWMDSRNVWWLHLAWINWVLLYASKEISFIVLFIFVTFMGSALLLAHSKKSLAWIATLPVGVLVAMKVLPALMGWAALPAIPFDEPSVQKSLAYAREMATSPQVILLAAWSAIWAAVLVWLLLRDRTLGQLRIIRAGLSTANPLSTALATVNPLRWQTPLLLGGLVVIAVPLYTGLFTNVVGGLMSGTVGGLFYWLAQQEVERGTQPWYYYVVMEPIYEPIAVLFGTLGFGYGVWWLVRRSRRGSVRFGVFEMSYALMMYWAFMSLLIYSWAGEKMPWLSVHITLPLIMLGAVFAARALGLEEGWRAVAGRRGGGWVFAGLAVMVTGWTVWRMADWSLRTDPSGPSPLVLGLLALLMLALVAAVRLGPSAALRGAGLFALAALTLYTVRSALQLSYFNGDVPVEQAVYVQTTPRVVQVRDAIAAVSRETSGGLSAPIIYDTEVSWPWVWYLRDFPNARYQAEGPDIVPTGDVGFVLVGAANEEKVRPYLRNYTAYRYPMRWWFPESMYRQIVPSAQIQDEGLLSGALIQARYFARELASWADPEKQAMLWRYVMYRKPDGILESTDMIVFVRNDLVGLYNEGRT